MTNGPTLRSRLAPDKAMKKLEALALLVLALTAAPLMAEKEERSGRE